MPEKKRPGGELASRPLHFIWIADCSGSMGVDGKIQSLNNAIREAIPEMRATAGENPNARVLMRAIKFSSGAQWHISQPTPIEEFKWEDLSAGGVTDMGKAFNLLAEQLKIPPMEERALPPVLVLVSDGQPSDDYGSGLLRIEELPWGQKAVRLAIAIGEDADHEVLEKFMGRYAAEVGPLQANNPGELKNFVRWVSTEVVKSASSPPSEILDEDTGRKKIATNIPSPLPPGKEEGPEAPDDVW